MVLAWTLFILYLLGTAYLGWRGHKKTGDFSSFAIGKGDMSPLVVGVTLAASTASAATFIINPGFIYVDGLSAWIHIVLGTFSGFTIMLYLLSFRFRQIGAEASALTLPDWIGKRYGSTNFSLYFSILNLLSFAFIVLLVGGISIVMQKLLGIGNIPALLITLIFVTGYVFIGGTYAHVFTNMLQGSLMIIVTIVVLISGLKLFLTAEPSFFGAISAQDPNLLKWVNPTGKLFNNVFSIYIAGFVVGASVVCQPHILTKALYVKSDKAVKQYLAIFTGIFILFLLLGSVGFFARITVPVEQLNDPTTGAFRQDLVMTMYLVNAFPTWVTTLIFVVLLAAAMSTLDGLLVSISTITANDLVANLVDRFGGHQLTHEEKMKISFKASHIILVVIAVLVFIVNLNPPKLLGIFGQVGVYGMVLAAVPPLLIGVLYKNVPIKLVWSTSLLAILTHFILYLYGSQIFPNTNLTFANPGVTATLGIIISLIPALAGGFFYSRNENDVNSTTTNNKE